MAQVFFEERRCHQFTSSRISPTHRLQPDNSVPPAFNGKRKTENCFLPAGELGHLGESLGIEDGQVRQDFAVQIDLGLFQAADKFTV